MPSDDAFLAMICEHYTESAPKLVYADWLEEQGRCDEATAWRWLGAEGKWPHRTKTGWHWFHACTGLAGRESTVYDPRVCGDSSYATLAQAFRAAVDAFVANLEASHAETA